MIRIMNGIEANGPAALTEALELATSHPRLVEPKGYKVPLYESPLC